jgi:hypothetical protein
VPRPDPNTFATFESRQKGGYARAAKLREQREIVEQIKLERLADRPTPRRRRRRRRSWTAYGIREPFAPAYRGADSPPLTAPVAPVSVLPANEQQARDRGLTGPVDIGRPRPFDAGRYEWS